MNINRHKRARNNLGKVLAAFFGCVALAVGLAVPAYGQATLNEQEISCATAADSTHLGNGCVVEYPKVTTPGKDEVPAVIGVYKVTIDGVESFVTGTITIGTASTLTVTDEEGVAVSPAETIAYDGSTPGPSLTVETVRAPVALNPKIVEVSTDVGSDSIAIGNTHTYTDDEGTDVTVATVVKGEDSIAIGNGASVGKVNEAKSLAPAVVGVYKVTIDGVESFVTGTITIGTASTLTVTDEEGVAVSPAETIAYDGSTPGPSLTVETVRAPVALKPAELATRDAAERATAIGTKAHVSGHEGVAIGANSEAGEKGTAIGAGASAGDNGIAIGAGAEAGANQIRIGADHTDVQIGDYNLGTIRGATETNAGGIATNRSGIATNTAGISTNAGGISDNGARIDTNVADISTNADDIETNTAGIATAVALAGLPVFKGGTGGWGIALGSFESETAVAIGANYNLNEGSSLIRFGISTSSGGTSGTIGFGKGF